MGDFNLIKIEVNIVSIAWKFTIQTVRKLPLKPHQITAGSMLATVLANKKTFPFHHYLQVFKIYLEKNWLDFFLSWTEFLLWELRYYVCF